MTPEMIAKNGFYDAILCVNPEKDGTILISARDENGFVSEGPDPWEELKNTIRQRNFSNNGEYLEKIKNIKGEFNYRNPILVWYRIYPESGKVEKFTNPPLGG